MKSYLRFLQAPHLLQKIYLPLSSLPPSKIASFGHSSTQALQFIHSSVIVYDIFMSLFYSYWELIYLMNKIYAKIINGSLIK
jgi:hypothetical protein